MTLGFSGFLPCYLITILCYYHVFSLWRNNYDDDDDDDDPSLYFCMPTDITVTCHFGHCSRSKSVYYITLLCVRLYHFCLFN